MKYSYNLKYFLRLFYLFFLVQNSSYYYSQSVPREYYAFIKTADSLYLAGNYEISAYTYSLAFKTIGWKGYPEDRYNAACSWALASHTDSAFFQLNRIVNGSYEFTDYDRLAADSNLTSLHKDKRWNSLLKTVKKNKAKAEVNFNWPLIYQLDSIFIEDQQSREVLDSVGKKFGYSSKETMFLWRTINKKDASNLVKVKRILDQYGWLGPDVIGAKGNSTLFLVIQHSDQQTQEKYLPIMRKAVKMGKASASNLALLEDRVALKQGKKQIYGSQITNVGGKFSISPIEDEANVNKRRAAVGLEPIEDYVKEWGIVYKPGMSNINNAKSTKRQKNNAIRFNGNETFENILLLFFGTVAIFLVCLILFRSWK